MNDNVKEHMNSYDQSYIELLNAQESAIEFLENNGLTEVEETKITIFLQNLYLANAVIIPSVEIQNLDWTPYKYFHKQFSKSFELITLLLKLTRWSVDPFVYINFNAIAVNFWNNKNTTDIMAMNTAMEDDAVKEKFYKYLAFSHAVLSEVRFSPIISDLEQTNYVTLLNEIDEENGRQIQLQVRLLKEIENKLTSEEREDIIIKEREKIVKLFTNFLNYFCKK